MIRHGKDTITKIEGGYEKDAGSSFHQREGSGKDGDASQIYTRAPSGEPPYVLLPIVGELGQAGREPAGTGIIGSIKADVGRNGSRRGRRLLELAPAKSRLIS